MQRLRAFKGGLRDGLRKDKVLVNMGLVNFLVNDFINEFGAA